MRPVAVIPAILASAAVAAGCGSGGSSSTGGGAGANPYGGGGGSSSGAKANAYATSQPAAPASSGAAAVGTRRTSLGTFVVDGRGRTLYLFEKDRGRRSSCSGACAAGWPPLTTTGRPRARAGAKASLLGTTKRSDGTLQLTYGGHPMYRYAGDSRAGQTNGQGSQAFGGGWYVVAPGGSKIDKS